MKIQQTARMLTQKIDYYVWKCSILKLKLQNMENVSKYIDNFVVCRRKTVSLCIKYY